MNIGTRDKRITIQAQSKVPDGMGGATVSYVDVATVWAAIWPISSSERLAAKQLGAEITHRVNIAYRSKFSTAWRIKFGNRYFAIVGLINPKEENKELQMTCQEAA